MPTRHPIKARALELAASGRFEHPREIHKVLLREGYTQSDIFLLQGRHTATQLSARCVRQATDDPACPGAQPRPWEASSERREAPKPETSPGM